MELVINDGGRAAAGFKGTPRDCVVRAVAIASGRPYQEVYDTLYEAMGTSPRLGVQTKDKRFKALMVRLGFTWTACMGVGTGCKVHLSGKELPKGKLVAACSRHYVAVIDGVVHDAFDSTRDGTRCVYGYWSLAT